jgi:hypothetical protein
MPAHTSGKDDAHQRDKHGKEPKPETLTQIKKHLRKKHYGIASTTPSSVIQTNRVGDLLLSYVKTARPQRTNINTTK